MSDNESIPNEDISDTEMESIKVLPTKKKRQQTEAQKEASKMNFGKELARRKEVALAKKENRVAKVAENKITKRQELVKKKTNELDPDILEEKIRSVYSKIKTEKKEKKEKDIILQQEEDKKLSLEKELEDFRAYKKSLEDCKKEDIELVIKPKKPRAPRKPRAPKKVKEEIELPLESSHDIVPEFSPQFAPSFIKSRRRR